MMSDAATARGGLHCMKKTEVPVKLAALATDERGAGALRAVVRYHTVWREKKRRLNGSALVPTA